VPAFFQQDATLKSQDTPKLRSCAGVERLCGIGFKLKVFCLISEFIPNNKNGLIPTLIGTATA
jgi:hypothetical protein